MLKDIYLKNSNLPKRYLNEITLYPSHADYDAYAELNLIKENIEYFVKNGENLLICSNKTGNGKTTWATKLIKSYIDSVQNISIKNQCPALFINVNNFLNEKKLAINDKSKLSFINDLEKKIISSNLVVFDDLAIKDLSDYDLNSLYYWIDERTNNMKSCIYTSNLEPAQLNKILDPRLFSRIVRYSKVIYFKDGDNRTC